MMLRSSLYLLILYMLFTDAAQAIGRANGGSRLLNGGTKGRPSRGYYGDRGYEKMQVESTTEKSHKPYVKPSSGGHGLSAWGIVGIVLALILSGVLAYYVVIFYPIFCKKERKYNSIELDAV